MDLAPHRAKKEKRQMRRTGIALALLVIVVPLVSADFQDILDTVDQHHEAEEYQRSRSLIESSLTDASGGGEKAELYWRLARAWLNLGDEAEDGGIEEEELLAYFERGEAEAQKAIDADPDNHLGYYWKSANIGRWGQVKGILNSLAKAKPMRDLLQQALAVEPEHADSYYVLGQLFEQVPGFPLSFGDPDYAVSLGRKSLDLHERQVEAGIEEEIDYDYYTEMARHLWNRNWSAPRRAREQARKQSKYRSISDPMEKNFYYEAEVTLRDISDREEALELITWVVRRLEGLSGRTDSQNDDLEEAREFLDSWQ
jgi:tetratricopeptide (TPR) repeat protein